MVMFDAGMVGVLRSAFMTGSAVTGVAGASLSLVSSITAALTGASLTALGLAAGFTVRVCGELCSGSEP